MVNIHKQGVNIIDVLLVFVVGLLSLFIAQSWDNRLADVFFTLSWIIVVVYVIASITGAFKNLILRTPTWTLTGLISIPLWLLVALIPIPSSTSLNINESNALVEIFGKVFVDNITQGLLIPIVETIVIVGFIMVFFLRQNQDNTPRIISGFGKNKQTSKKFGLLLIFIALFGAILHYVVGLQLIGAGIGFDFFLLHQILSFFIFGFIAISPLGLGGAIASHIVKNVFAVGDFNFLIAVFIMFIILDFIAIKTNKKENTHKRVLKSTGLSV